MAFEAEVFGDDAGVPGTAGGGDQAGDEERENAGKNDRAPALPGAEVKEAGDFFEVVGDGDGTGDDVEEDVPLCAEEHEENGGGVHATAVADKDEQEDGEERGGGDTGGDLGDGLSDAGEPRVKADGDAGGDRPKRGEKEGQGDAEEGCAGTEEDELEIEEVQ